MENSKKLAEQLADKVVGSVVKAGVREDILAVLLRAVENNVREAATQSLLVCIGHAVTERDKQWVRELAGPWAPKSSLRTAAGPADVEREIREWHAAGLQEIRAAAYEAGYKDAFQTGVERGTKFGFGAKEAGYTGLEEVLKAAALKIRAT